MVPGIVPSETKSSHPREGNSAATVTRAPDPAGSS